MFLCLCVHTYTCVYVCMCVCVFVWLCVHTNTCVYVCVYVCYAVRLTPLQHSQSSTGCLANKTCVPMQQVQAACVRAVREAGRRRVRERQLSGRCACEGCVGR